MRRLLLFASAALAVAPVFAADPFGGYAGPNFCTKTADLLYISCFASVRDDTYVGKAVCTNITDLDERVECFADVEASRLEALNLCAGQRNTRLGTCGSIGQGRYDPDFDPSLFDDPRNASNPNPFFPLAVGNLWNYDNGRGETDRVEVVNESKLIADVGCIVVRDLVSRDGFVAEATDDWYAHAKSGATWYFGEEVKNYEIFEGDDPVRPELVSIDGSFKAGREGDKPGIIFLAAPHVGDVYVEEASLNNAEDVTEVLSTAYKYGADAELDEFVPRPLADHFCSGSGDCVVTKNFSLLEPGLFARKYYARGIGVFLEVEVNVGEAISLVSCNFDSRCDTIPAK